MPRKKPKDTRPKDTRPIKTLEFKLYPNQSQVLTLTDWLDRGRRVWNNGLAVLLEKDQQDWRKKAGFDPMDGNEVWQWFPNKVGDETVFGACCSVVNTWATKKHKLEFNPDIKDLQLLGQCCPIRHPQPLDGAPRSLIYQAAKLDNFCTRFKNGIVSDLMESWKAYKDKKRVNAKMPKFKGKRFPLTSLSNANASTTVKLKGDNKIQFPLVGDIRTKGLRNRIPPGGTVVEARICRKATGWFLQLATRYDWPVPNVKMPDVAVAIDPGVRFATSTDYGRQVDAPKFLMKQAKKLRREQRKLSRRFQKGKPQSKNWLKQKAKVGRLHEKVSRQRNAFWQKESTYFVTSFGGIAIENNSFNNMGRKAKPKPREDGKGWERNNAAAKSGLNRSLKDVACGKLKVMVEAKKLAIGNEVHLVKSNHNSQKCSNCGHVAKENRKSQSNFNCVNCGHSMNADINAAINIHNRADWSNRYNLHPHRLQYSLSESTPLSLGEVKPASASHKSSNGIEGQQEGEQSPRSEITEQSRSPGLAKIGKAERGQKPRNLCQNLEKPTQLTLWDIA
jgi:transposase